MGTNIIILPAACEQEEAVYGLMNQLEGAELDRKDFLSIFSENLKNKDIFYFVAMLDGCVAGFSSLHVQRLLHHAAFIGEIQEIVVSEGCRNHGIGQALFEQMRKTAIHCGCIQLEVCCRKDRARSHDFYRKMNMLLSHDKLCLPLKEEA